MKKTIVIVGATGNLGGKIVNALLANGAEVKAIVRLSTSQNKIIDLEQKCVNVFKVDITKKYKIFKPSGINFLNGVIKLTKFLSPSKHKLYPAWQGMQYMRDMIEGLIFFKSMIMSGIKM